jgi:alkaline phosphatase
VNTWAALGVWVLLAASAACRSSSDVTTQGRARNVVLFLGDGTGLSTVHAASVHGYGEAQKLYIQRMPHLGFSETSSAGNWVTDSAAGMTAIVTGEKTNNGVISQSADSVRGKRDGRLLKSILEYAEEKGLSTGVVTNSPVADATPAATFAHANERANFGEIFRFVIQPCYGDGVDVAIGPGLERIVSENAGARHRSRRGTAEEGFRLPAKRQRRYPQSRRGQKSSRRPVLVRRPVRPVGRDRCGTRHSSAQPRGILSDG